MDRSRTSVPYHQDGREISLGVLAELAPDEREVALGFLDPLIEMAAGDELAWIDSGDHSGGFGGSDVLFVTVIPAVVAMLTHIGFDNHGRPLPSLPEIQDLLRQFEGIEAIVRRTGSQRAADRVAEISQAVHKVTLRHLAAKSSSRGRSGVADTTS
jgi:hypothetical protein